MSQSNKIMKSTAIVNGRAMSVETFNGKLFKIFDDEGNLVEDRSADFQNELSPPPDIKPNKGITSIGSSPKESQEYLVKECPECKSASLLPLYLGNSIRYRCQSCDNVFVREIPGSKEQKKSNKKPMITKPKISNAEKLKGVTKTDIATIKPKDTAKTGITVIDQDVVRASRYIPKIDATRPEPQANVILPEKQITVPEKQITTPEPQTNVILPEKQITAPEVRAVIQEKQTVTQEARAVTQEAQTVTPEIQSNVVMPETQTVTSEVQSVKSDVQTIAPEVQTTAPEVQTKIPEKQTTTVAPKIEPTIPKIDIIKLEPQKKISKEVPDKPKGASISNIKAPIINHPSKIMEEKTKPTDKPVVKTKSDNISKVEPPKAEILKEAPKFEQGKIKKTREARMIDEEEETTEERKFEKWLNKQKFKENVEKMAEIAKENQEEIGGISKEITNVKDGIGDMENKIQVLRDNLQSTLGDTKKPITETLGELCTGVDCIKEDVKKYQDTQSELDKKLDSRFSELRERVQKLEEPTYVCDNCGQDGIKALSSYCPNCGSPIHEWYDDTGHPVKGWAPHWKRTSIRQNV